MNQLKIQLLKFVESLKINKLFLVCIGIAFSCIFIACKKNEMPLKIEKMMEVKKTENITIFVHGTHTDLLTEVFKRVLFIPKHLTSILDLDEYSYVKWFVDKMALADPAQFPLNSFYAIGWSGILSSQERVNAAENLYNEITKLVLDLRSKGVEPKITIIGHSHGGNVALNLAKIHQASHVSKDSFKINKLVLLATPVQEETENFIESDIFEKVYSIYSNADMIQVLDPQGLQNAKSSFFSHRRFKHHDKLKQTKLKVNDRAILHEEFVFHNFPKILPKLIEVMDKLVGNDHEHLLKVEFKNGEIINIEIK
ncbi:MAG: hypothetical protein P4L22_00575 [Candidatus Babeliales bacterium]|nr:hypothetical protein [Candidatus Babeliales bacterium]